MKHKIKDGQLIDLKDLELDHLNNILNWIQHKAQKGVINVYKKEVWDIDDIWLDDYTLYEKNVKNHFNYKAYKKELERRIKLEKRNVFKDFFESINYSLLQEQKEELLKFQFDCDYGLPIETLNKLEGLVNFIDNLQDFVVDKLGYEESKVFNSKK